MGLSSIFKIKIDFEKSKGSYLYDGKRKKYFLDFFGQYSTLTIGYNHKIFQTKEYFNVIKKISHQKITNCEILSNESQNFKVNFKNKLSNAHFQHFHFCCTGALAIEAAVKTALDYNKRRKKIISFKNSFHGINGYGGILTDRFEPVRQRLDGFPGEYFEKIDGPFYLKQDKLNQDLKKKINDCILEIEKKLKGKDIACILIEPVMATAGDLYYPVSFFRKLSKIAKKYDTPLIFDEIQTGFYTSGKKWYYEHLGIIPDIVVFGKKTQLSGIMVKKKFNQIFKKSIRLEVTWDADLIDMVRFNFILKSIKNNSLKKNIKKFSDQIFRFLSSKSLIKNPRVCGYLIAFDMDTGKLRDKFFNELFKNGMLSNKTSEKTIRFRPHLMLNNDELNHAKMIINKSINNINRS
jgi:L-lysine 6-transaminase